MGLAFLLIQKLTEWLRVLSALVLEILNLEPRELPAAGELSYASFYIQ